MYHNPFIAQLVAKERIKDAMRQAEQAHLVREAEGPRKSWGWPLPMVMALKGTQAFMNQPHLKRHVKA